MLVSVNPNDALPLYHQIVREVRHAIASGALKPLDKLPSQRDLARQLVISHLTVKKAYDLLEAEGLIRTLQGRGTFVSARPPAQLRRQSADALRRRLDQLADSARLLGMTRRDFIRLLESSWPVDPGAPAGTHSEGDHA